MQTYGERAFRQWLTQFDGQVQGIEKYIKQYLKNYWLNIVGEQVNVRMEEMRQIEQQINQLPIDKKQALDTLLQEELQLQSALSQLHQGYC